MTEQTTAFTAEDFFNLLARSGLLDDKLFETQKQRFLKEDASPKSILQQMVAEHLITNFQAKQLGERRHRGFFLSEKYKILDFLGQGGMSRVLLCEHMLLHRLVAVKILNKALDKFPGATERFLREARASASMDHPNIARVFDVERTGLGPAIIMEYVDGTNLHELATKLELLNVNRVAHYIRQAAIGLQQAHQAGLVHRDIKPANLMIDRNGTVKLLDLGLARFFDPARTDNLTQQIDASCIIGTADYIAPEQVMESSSADIRADIYSLGYTMYFLLTRKLPAGDGPVMKKLLWHQTRSPEPIRSVRPEVSEGLAAVLEKMTSKNPEDRYQTPAELVTALAPWTKVPIPPPTEEEMPKNRASAYRLGLCAPPDPAKLAAANMSSSTKSGIESALPKGSPADPHQPSSDVKPEKAIEGSSVIGFINPLGSNAILPVGSTIRSSRTSEVMSASTETAATRESSYIRSREKTLQPLQPWLWRFAQLFLLGAAIAFSVVFGICVTLWWQAWNGARQFAQVPYRPQRIVVPNSPAPPPTSPASVAPARNVVLRSGGSTFIRPAMEHWANIYEAQTGVKIEYFAAGSSKGVDGLISNFLDFSCTDAYLTDEEIAEFGSKVVHIPLALGAVVPTYNLTNENGQAVTVRFTGAILAKIYLGKIKKWNDPGIAVSNLGIELPDLDITVVCRKDGSGTTAIWTDYLSHSSSAWKNQIGMSSRVDWPVGVRVEKNDGVADEVSRTVGAIGYVEYSYALANGLAVGLVKNKAGEFVEPSIESISAAATSSLRDVPDDLRYSLIDAPGERSYPIVGTCWALLRTDQHHERQADCVRFLRWATKEGQGYVTNLRYGRLPDELSDRIQSLLDKAAAEK